MDELMAARWRANQAEEALAELVRLHCLKDCLDTDPDLTWDELQLLDEDYRVNEPTAWARAEAVVARRVR